MATSPSHKLGQMIGNLLEEVLLPILEEVCEPRNLYLDIVGKKRSVRPGKKLSWYDSFGNKHDLDFVIEVGGSDEKQGRPIAFIEAAWRRYTKHSKNKAQEIQGAVLPLAEKHKYDQPFLGAVIAGEFTAPSIEQLESTGFKVLYFKYESIVQAFQSQGMDIRFGEDTPNETLEAMVSSVEEKLEDDNLKKRLIEEIRRLNEKDILSFKRALEATLDRETSTIIIIPMYGNDIVFNSPAEALEFLESYHTEDVPSDLEFKQFTIIIHYTNGNKITAEFTTIEAANSFIKRFYL